MQESKRLRTVVLVVAMLTACDGGDDGGTAPTPAIGIALSSATLGVVQGASGTVNVTLTRTGDFAGAVALTATGLPNGVTATFDPPGPTGNTAALTLAATPTAAIGPATVTIRGTAAGLAERTATLALTVSAAPPVTGNTTWAFCTAADTPPWLAVQDGAGAWTRVTPTGTTFRFNIGARGGVAYLLPNASAITASASRTPAGRTSVALETARLLRTMNAGAGASPNASRSTSLFDRAEVKIAYGTQAELNAQGMSQCLPGTNKSVSGSVADLSATQSALVTLGNVVHGVSGGATTFTFTGVPDGPLDLVAARASTTAGSVALDRVIIRRGLNPANNSTLPVLDFSSGEAFAPAEAAISVGNLGSDAAFLSTFYVTTGAKLVTLFSPPERGAGPFRYYGVPAAKQSGDDLHFAVAVAASATETTDDGFRFAGLYFKEPTDRALTLGPVLPSPVMSAVAKTPYVRFRATGTLPSEYARFITAEFVQLDASTLRNVVIDASAAYLNDAATYDLSVPDFTGVAGWDNNWGLRGGQLTDWMMSGVGFTGSGARSPNPVDGATIRIAFRLGTIIP